MFSLNLIQVFDSIASYIIPLEPKNINLEKYPPNPKFFRKMF